MAKMFFSALILIPSLSKNICPFQPVFRICGLICLSQILIRISNTDRTQLAKIYFFAWIPSLSKNISTCNLLPVLRIRNVYTGSRILIFTHPGSRVSDPGSKNSFKREG
jgi:hypothetical protein